MSNLVKKRKKLQAFEIPGPLTNSGITVSGDNGRIIVVHNACFEVTIGRIIKKHFLPFLEFYKLPICD